MKIGIHEGTGGMVSGDDDGIVEPNGQAGRDDGVGWMGQVICIYPYVPSYVSEEASIVVNNAGLNTVLFNSYDQGDFPNKESMITSLRLRKSMKENNDKTIYFYEINDQLVPVIRKGDQRYKLLVDEKDVTIFLVYKDLFQKK